MADNVLKRYASLEKKVSAAQNEAERAKGAFDQIMETMQKEFGVSSLEEARNLLADLERSENTLRKTLKKKLTTFERRYGDFLNDD